MHANGTGKCNSYCNYRYIFTFICIVIINFFIIIFWRLLQFQIISIMVNVKKIKKNNVGRSATIFDTVNKLFGLKLETAILSIPPLEYNNCSLYSLAYCLKSQTNIHEIDQVILKNQCSTKHIRNT